jgi:hypothetical protein
MVQRFDPEDFLVRFAFYDDLVGELVQQEHCSIVGLQETKLTVFSDQLVCDMLGTGFDYSFSPGNWYSRGDRDSLPFSCLVGF